MPEETPKKDEFNFAPTMIQTLKMCFFLLALVLTGIAIYAMIFIISPYFMELIENPTWLALVAFVFGYFVHKKRLL